MTQVLKQMYMDILTLRICFSYLIISESPFLGCVMYISSYFAHSSVHMSIKKVSILSELTICLVFLFHSCQIPFFPKSFSP